MRAVTKRISKTLGHVLILILILVRRNPAVRGILGAEAQPYAIFYLDESDIENICHFFFVHFCFRRN